VGPFVRVTVDDVGTPKVGNEKAGAADVVTVAVVWVTVGNGSTENLHEILLKLQSDAHLILFFINTNSTYSSNIA